MQATLECDLTVPPGILSYSRFFSRIITQASIVCASFTHFFSVYPSDPFLPARETPPLCLSTVRVNKWVRGFHYASSVFKATLSLADISEVFCVKCEGRDSLLPPPPAPTESGQLFNTLRPPSPSCFFPYQMSDFTQIITHNAGCGCWRFFELIHHVTQGYVKFSFRLIR